MDPWDLRLFQLSNIIGFTPFRVNKSTRLLQKVRWKSVQGLYFLLVAAISLAFLIYYCGSFYLLMTRKGVAFSMRTSSWIGATAIICAVQWTLIMRHEKIVTHLNEAYLLLGQKSEASLKWQRDKKTYFIFGFLIFGVVPMVSISGHIILAPGDIYMHNLLEAYTQGFDPIWRIVSNVIHCYATVICTFGTFFCDSLLVFFALGYFRHFEEINENLMPVKGATVHTPASRLGGQNIIAVELLTDASEKSPEESELPWTWTYLRTNLRRHLRLQHSLDSMNYKFDVIILAFPLQIFLMVLAIFFSIARDELSDQLEIMIYCSVGVQFLVRSFIGIYNFGKVHDSGSDAKYILIRDLQIQNHHHLLEPGMIFEIESFLATGDDVAFKAGSYLAFKKSSLISYYGALASYMALMVQSF